MAQLGFSSPNKPSTLIFERLHNTALKLNDTQLSNVWFKGFRFQRLRHPIKL